MFEDTRHTALGLGYAGLVPFIGLAILSILVSADEAYRVEFFLLTYAAIILSFLGGVVWGRVMRKPNAGIALVISNAAALVGWIAVLVGEATGLVLSAFGFALILLYDLRSDLPDWFRRLRVHLSIGAIGSTLFAALL